MRVNGENIDGKCLITRHLLPVTCGYDYGHKSISIAVSIHSIIDGDILLYDLITTCNEDAETLILQNDRAKLMFD